MTKTHTVPAGQFKAGCLALLDRVARTGEEVIVTKRGKPVARIVPFTPRHRPSLVGSVKTRGDIVGPILDEWELDA